MQELAEQVQQYEGELKEVQDKFAVYRDEMADTELRIESLTLDLEIAEENVTISRVLSFRLSVSALVCSWSS